MSDKSVGYCKDCRRNNNCDKQEKMNIGGCNDLFSPIMSDKSCDNCGQVNCDLPKGYKSPQRDYCSLWLFSPDKSEKKSYAELQEKYAELFNDDHYGCDDYPVLKMLKDYTNELLTLIRNKEGK